MAEASVDAPAGVAGESGVSITNIEGSGGFEPFVANARRIPLRVRFGRRGGVDVAVDSTSKVDEHGVDQSRCLVDAQRAEDALVTSTLARFGRSSP